jgi:GTP 3',8-cyclase
VTFGLPVLDLPRERRADPARDAATPPPAPPEARRAGRMIDSHGRTIRDLRLSITDRCNFRCVYCLDPDVKFMDRRELLSIDEMVRLAGICAAMGVEKIRLTGGEPTLHPRLEEIIRRVSALGVNDLALTTNGSLLDEARLERWHSAGLTRITVSIDSIGRDRFAAITRSGTTPGRIVEGIGAAVRIAGRSARPAPVKVNAVIVRGYNEDEVVALAGLARDLGVEMRFIEYMPLDSSRAWSTGRLVPAAEILARIAEVYALVPAGRDDASSTSLAYTFADGAPGRIGIIAPVTRPFCGACSRLRLTADGHVRPCLFSRREWDLRPLLRTPGTTDAEIRRFLIDVTWMKQAGHGITSPGFEQPDRPMSAIGG